MNARTPIAQGERLARRLADHRKNISKAVTTLSIDDFECRFLLVQSGYETAAEDYLIYLFKPIWNNETGILYGLGKHGDAATTRQNKRSPWDTLHPGRTWAGKTVADARPKARIMSDLAKHFANTRIYEDLNDVLRNFSMGCDRYNCCEPQALVGTHPINRAKPPSECPVFSPRPRHSRARARRHAWC